MRLLVTGGAGFIGSAFVRHCLRETVYEIVNVDKLTYAADLENLDEVLPNTRYRFVKADVADAEAMSRVFATYDPDGIIHLAAEFACRPFDRRSRGFYKNKHCRHL